MWNYFWDRMRFMPSYRWNISSPIWKIPPSQSLYFWDDQLSTDTAQEINKWTNELPRRSEMIIPRSYFPVDVDEIELHVLGDSS